MLARNSLLARLPASACWRATRKRRTSQTITAKAPAKATHAPIRTIWYTIARWKAKTVRASPVIREFHRKSMSTTAPSSARRPQRKPPGTLGRRPPARRDRAPGGGRRRGGHRFPMELADHRRGPHGFRLPSRDGIPDGPDRRVGGLGGSLRRDGLAGAPLARGAPAGGSR